MTEDQRESIFEHYSLTPQYFIWQIDSKGTKDDFIEEYIITELYGDEDSEKVLAIMEYDLIDFDDAISLISTLYSVYTVDQMNSILKDYAEDYLETLMDETPESLKCYVNVEDFVSDYLASEDPGNIIGTYDGSYAEEEINNTEYFIFKFI